MQLKNMIREATPYSKSWYIHKYNLKPQYKGSNSLFKHVVYSQMQFKNTIQGKHFHIYKLVIFTNAFEEFYKGSNSFFKQLIYSQMQLKNTVQWK